MEMFLFWHFFHLILAFFPRYGCWAMKTEQKLVLEPELRIRIRNVLALGSVIFELFKKSAFERHKIEPNCYLD